MPKSVASLALNQMEVSELKAHHLACSHLVRGCQDAIFRFRGSAAAGYAEEPVTYRTVEILEDIVASWCETVSMLRSALEHASSPGVMQADSPVVSTPKASAAAPAMFAGSS